MSQGIIYDKGCQTSIKIQLTSIKFNENHQTIVVTIKNFGGTLSTGDCHFISIYYLCSRMLII